VSHAFSSLKDFLLWLDRFVNLEGGQKPSSFRPERMVTLTELTGHPERCAPAIHVAGSKGKGSVISMAGAILTRSGLRVCRYLSPHIADFRERITLDGAFLPDEAYMTAADELKACADGVSVSVMGDNAGKFALFDPACGGEAPTYFELLTLFYFLCARTVNADVLAVETGMGGRLDPTNVVDPLVSIITVIEKEHTEFLGGTLAEIAGEKAGIIKRGRPLVLAAQPPEALAVFRETCARMNAPLFYLPEFCRCVNVRFDAAGTGFTLKYSGEGFWESVDLRVGTPGSVQAENAALAAAACKLAFPALTETTIRQALAGFCLPARFEKLAANGQPVIVDGAHTEKSAALCAQTFVSIYGGGGILLFGCAQGKNAAAMAAALLPHFAAIVITTPGVFKPSAPDGVFADFIAAAKAARADGARAGEIADDIILVRDTKAAVKTALSAAARLAKPVLVCGSFYLAAEVRQAVADMNGG
jgi:dihydrofolate synthase/folylpolyglutamate synthase